jgi:hypothetical protein
MGFAYASDFIKQCKGKERWKNAMLVMFNIIFSKRTNLVALSPKHNLIETK